MDERIRLPAKGAGRTVLLYMIEAEEGFAVFMFFAYESERSWGQKEVVAGYCRVVRDGLNSLMTCTIIYKNIDFLGIK